MSVNKIVTKVDGVENKTIDFNDLKSGLSNGSHTITVEAYNGATLISTQTRNITIVEEGAPTTGLVADYNFNETSGDLIDSVNGYNGTLFGSIARDGSKYTFNGSNTYIEIPDNNYFSFNNAGVDVPFTIRVKITFDSLEDGWIINKRDDPTAGNQEWQLIIYQGNLSFGAFDKNSNNSTLIIVRKNIATSNLAVGTSYHIVVKYDGSGLSSGFQLILNKNETLYTDSSVGTFTGFANSLSKLVIGKFGFGTLYSASKIDSIRIHKGYEWTTQEISDDFDSIMI